MLIQSCFVGGFMYDPDSISHIALRVFFIHLCTVVIPTLNLPDSVVYESPVARKLLILMIYLMSTMPLFV